MLEIGTNAIIKAKIIAHINPKIKFAKIPAIEVSLIPFLYFLKLSGFIGIGFAQPTPKSAKHNKPDKLICLKGLSVTLPANLGVGSPIFVAVKPCANSWTDIETKKATSVIKKITTASCALKSLLNKI